MARIRWLHAPKIVFDDPAIIQNDGPQIAIGLAHAYQNGQRVCDGTLASFFARPWLNPDRTSDGAPPRKCKRCEKKVG